MKDKRAKRWDDAQWDGTGSADATAAVTSLRTELLGDPAIRARYDEVEEELAALVARKNATLADLRKAFRLTQAQLAADLGMSQSELSKLERRPNLLLSTLARYIEATGGRLRVVAVYGDGDAEVEVDIIRAIEPAES